nr:hypothetical protein [Tanacetum cinerariifolium]
MNYLEEQTDGEAMINSIQNEKKTRKIDHLARSLLIQGLPNDIYSLIDSNETAKDLWDALKRQMRGSKYAEQDRKAAILYEYETFIATEGEQLIDTYLRYLQVINDLKKCGYKKDNYELNYKFLNNLQPEWKQYGTLMRQTKNLMNINIDTLYNLLKQNQGDVNDALGYKKKAVVVTSDPLALVVEKTKVSKRKEKVVVSSDSEGSDYNYYKTKMLLAKKDSDEQVLLAEDRAWMESSSDSDQEINANTVFMAQIEKTKMLLAKKYSDEQVLLAEDQAWMESSSDSDQEINANTVFMAQIEKVLSDSDESSSSAEETIAEVNTFEEKNNEFNEQMKVLNEKNADLLAQTKVLQDQLKQTSSLKPYVVNVILEKIIIDLEDEVVSLLEKEKANLKTIKSLKSKGFESGENAISESKNQSENDCHVVEIECDKVENPKNVENKTKRKRRKRKSSKQNDKQVNNDVSRANSDFVHFLDLDTFSSVRRPKHSDVIWKKKLSSNTSNVDLSSVSHLKLNKDVKRYSRKDLLSCNNSHLGETSSAYVCNDAMNVSCNHRLCDLFDENKLFIFDDESVRISPVIKMPFRKKPHDSMNIYLWIIDLGCSKHMTGNRALLTNFVEKFLGTVCFGNNDFAVIAGYGDVVIGSMII